MAGYERTKTKLVLGTIPLSPSIEVSPDRDLQKYPGSSRIVLNEDN